MVISRIANTWRIPAAVCLTTSLLACSDADSNIFRVGTDVDAETLDARLLRNTTGTRVAGLIYDALIQLDASLEPQPDLAESWAQVDSTTWVFRLRSDAYFHDGAQLTAEDVVYTFETILDPALRSPLKTLYAPIESVAAIDRFTVRFTLREPYAPFLSYLDLGIVPKHLGQNGHDLSSRPIGSGPYALLEWAKGNKISLRADSSHRLRPGIERIDIVLVPDNTARAQAFESGDLDLIQSPLAPQDVKRLTGDSRFAHVVVPGPAVTYFNFNTARDVFADPGVRRAITQLIDQETIVGQIYEGMDDPATSILLPTSWAYTPDIEQPRFGPDSADLALRALGWADTDQDGWLDKNGVTLAVEIGTHIEDANRVQTVEYLQNIFVDHGINATVHLSDWASFSAERDAGNYDLILLGWTQIVDPDRVTYEPLHSRGGLNWGGYVNPEVDRALEIGRRSSTREERIRAYQDAAQILSHEVPYYVLSYQGYQVYHTRALVGFEPNSRGRLRSLARARLTTSN